MTSFVAGVRVACVCTEDIYKPPGSDQSHVAECMDELCLSVDLKAVGNPDSSLPDLPVLLSVEGEDVPSLEGLHLADEAYELRITDLGVSILANHPHGLFNGAISLVQLLPPCAPMSGDIQLDCLEVRHSARDYPHAIHTSICISR
jgi:hypothetical protein